MLGSRFVEDPPKRDRSTPGQGGFTKFTSERDNLSISYPLAWRRLPVADPDVLLLAAAPEASILMRRRRIGVDVEPGAVNRAKRLTDKLVMKGESVRQLRPPRKIENLGGLPGWLYIYSFRDEATGRRGAHAHYFLFRDDTMVTLVFQTVPSERFANYAPLFDRVAGTFKAGPVEVGSPG